MKDVDKNVKRYQKRKKLVNISLAVTVMAQNIYDSEYISPAVNHLGCQGSKIETYLGRQVNILIFMPTSPPPQQHKVSNISHGTGVS